VDHLWSPWRLDYVTAEKPLAGCVFCLAAEASAKPGVAADGTGGGARDGLVVFRGVTAYVVLNRYPYNNGHLMVVTTRHVATLADLSADELQEVAALTQRSEAVLRQAYRLEGINVGINLGKAAGAGIHEHLHVHLVPRWSGDTNFMTVVGETRVLPEDLASTAARLSPIFVELATPARDQSA
jgi:ATP adenylyltransferase